MPPSSPAAGVRQSRGGKKHWRFLDTPFDPWNREPVLEHAVLSGAQSHRFGLSDLFCSAGSVFSLGQEPASFWYLGAA